MAPAEGSSAQDVSQQPTPAVPQPDKAENVEVQPGNATEASSVAVDPTQTEQAQSKDGVETGAQPEPCQDGDTGATEEEEQAIMAEAKAKAKWWKVSFINDDYKPGTMFYYVNIYDNSITQWEEPEEPSWLVNQYTKKPVKNGICVKGGINYQAYKFLGLDEQTEYIGYNPSIHGKYDPTAYYAQPHMLKHLADAANQKQAEKDNETNTWNDIATGTQLDASQAPPNYAAPMALNRFSGHAQAADASERHTDEAKSARQQGAFFDVEKAANAHGGRSLKEERRQHKATKAEIQEWKRKKHEQKRKKLMSQYK